MAGATECGTRNADARHPDAPVGRTRSRMPMLRKLYRLDEAARRMRVRVLSVIFGAAFALAAARRAPSMANKVEDDLRARPYRLTFQFGPLLG
jgi:hypothetical protein